MSSTTAMWSGRSRRASRRTAALSSCTTSVGRRSIRPRAMASRRRWESMRRNRSRRTRRCSTRRSCERVRGHRDLHAAFPPKTRATSASLTQRLFRHIRGSPAVFVTHELLRRETVEERAYQVNIARACLERSTLVVLPTGMGKTVIAAMVIAEVLRRRGGRILFLAPTKPLVEQHATSMRNVLVVDRITLFTGEATAPEDRELLWRENKIIVSTPQVIRNDLRAERISLDDVSLIVFDEAHRAVDDYAYVDVAAADKDVPGRLVLGTPEARRAQRQDSVPRDRARPPPGARLPPIVLREHGEGSENEGGRAIPEAREGARADPPRRGHGGRAPEAC